MTITARLICLVLAIIFFLFAAFNFPSRTTPWPVSWRDLAYAMVVLSFLV